MLLLLTGGLQFGLWVAHFRYGTPYVPKPSSIGAFLPLSGLVGIKAWIATGYIPRVHPAAFIILLAVLLTAIFFKRGVCSWVCPIGLLHELARKAGIRLAGSRHKPPKYLDYLFRGIKYLILAFFLKVILVDFSGQAAIAFLQTDYNALSPVKLLDFWMPPSTLTIGVLGVLAIGTMFVEDIWCRYLCPYGALLSLIGWISPVSTNVERNTDVCTQCGACTAACPSGITIDETEVVTSLECTQCSQCISTCPEDALTYRAAGREISPLTMGAGILLLITGVVGVAIVTGHWQSVLNYEAWSHLISGAKSVSHPPV